LNACKSYLTLRATQISKTLKAG